MSDSPLFSDIASYSSITSSDRDNYLEELPFESPRSERSELLDDFLEKLEDIETNTEDSLPTLETNLPDSDTFSPKKKVPSKTAPLRATKRRRKLLDSLILPGNNGVNTKRVDLRRKRQKFF